MVKLTLQHGYEITHICYVECNRSVMPELSAGLIDILPISSNSSIFQSEICFCSVQHVKFKTCFNNIG